MVETLRNALVRNRLTMGEISLIRGAIRSLVEGPRRRAIESDTQRAREVVMAWIRQQPSLKISNISEFWHLNGKIFVKFLHDDGRFSGHFFTLKDWQVENRYSI
jgi:hypothetical protein